MTSEVSITICNYCFSHNISYLPRQFVTPSLAAPLPVIVQIFYILFQPPNLAGLYPSSLPVFSDRLIVLFVPTNRTLVISCGSDQLILLFKYNNNIDNLLGLINRTIAKYRFIFQFLLFKSDIGQIFKVGNLFHNKLFIHVMITIFRDEN